MYKPLAFLWFYLLVHCSSFCIEKYETCGCKNIKGKQIEDPKAKDSSKATQGKKLECSQINVESMFAEANLPEDSVIISLTNNIVEEISNVTFGSRRETLSILQRVKKLDLSVNQIGIIYPHAFSAFHDLTRLNLSSNKIGRLSSDMFYGLSNLEILDLSKNSFPIIAGDVLRYVPSLKKLNVKLNDLVCNCLMEPFITWLKTNTSKSSVKVRGTCSVPQRLMNTDLRSLKSQDLACGPNYTLNSLPHFKMEPSVPQLVFEGDELDMFCEGTDLATTDVVWSYNGSRITDKVSSSYMVNTSHYIHRTVVSGQLKIKSLAVNHSGAWKCTIASKYGNKSSFFQLLVVKQKPEYCQYDAVRNRKGTFVWHEVVTGVTASVRCPVLRTGDSIYPRTARRTCESGQWRSGMYQDCLYTDIVAKLVHDTLNTKLTQKNVLQVAKKLVSSLQTETVREPYSVELIGDLSERLMVFTSNLSKENDIGDQILQLASFVMSAEPSLLRSSEIASKACEKILRVVRNVALKMMSTSFFSKHSPNIAIVGIKFNTKSQFDEQGNDMICTVDNTKLSIKLTCDKTSKPLHKIGSFVKVPSTLLNSYTEEGVDGYKLYFIVYRNGNLFQPRFERGSNETDSDGGRGAFSTNMVMEAGINGKPVVNLTEKAVFGFVNSNSSVHTAAQWSPNGGWTKDESCFVPTPRLNLTQVHCSKITNMTLLYDPNAKNSNSATDLSLANLAHPAVLIGTGVLMILLISVILSYICCYSKLGITSDARHMLVNICVHLALAACAFALGIWRVDNRVLCLTCGIILHYSSLSVLLWIAISARNIHREMIIHNSPPSLDPKPKRPMLRFYLIGCGIPTVVCGITAAAKMQNYDGDKGKYCWLSWETSVYAFYLPAALIAIICIILLIRMLCALNRATNAGARVPRSPVSNVRLESPECSFASNNDRFDDMYVGNVTENTPLQYTLSNHGNAAGQDGVSSACIQPDNEQSYGTRLRGVSLLLFFFLATWVVAAISVAAPSFQEKSTSSNILFQQNFHSIDYAYLKHSSMDVSGHGSDLSNIFSYLYAMLAIAMGVFLVVQHMVCRRDVRACWGEALSACKGSRRAERGHGTNSQTSSTPLRNGEISSTMDEGQESRVHTPPYDKTSASQRTRKLHQDGILPALPSDRSMIGNVMQSSRIEEKQNGSRVTSADGSHRHERSPDRSWHTGFGSSSHVKSFKSSSGQHQIPYQHRHGRGPYHSHNSVHSGIRHMHGMSPQPCHPHMIESSSARVYSQPVYSHDHCLAGSAGFQRDSPYGHYHHSQHGHSHIMPGNGNPMKLTNLLVAHDSSMTEHSFDELTQNNMHTIPVIMQHTQPKVDNSLLYYRYQKMRRALDQKKSKQNKLMVLREYAQDPLTSNDEAVDKSKEGEGSPLIRPSEKNDPKNNLLRNYSNKNSGERASMTPYDTKYKQLLIASPSSKKKDAEHSRTGVAGQGRRNRSTERGGKNSTAATRSNKHGKRRSGNSTLSERERDTTSSEKSDPHPGTALHPCVAAASEERCTDSQSVTCPDTHGRPVGPNTPLRPAAAEKDNHGYLTLQQLMSISSFLPQKNTSPEKDNKVTDESIKDFSSVLEDESLSPSLGSSLLFKRNETSV